jgi:hypothetical protein
MTKYEPLKSFLATRAEGEVPLTFAQIEEIIGAPLPPVAFKHRAWWSNNPSNSVITRAWLDAGFRTERVDMGSQKLVFRRDGEVSANKGGPGLIERLQARLAGTVTFAPGFDPTEPTGEVWDAER